MGENIDHRSRTRRIRRKKPKWRTSERGTTEGETYEATKRKSKKKARKRQEGRGRPTRGQRGIKRGKTHRTRDRDTRGDGRENRRTHPAGRAEKSMQHRTAKSTQGRGNPMRPDQTGDTTRGMIVRWREKESTWVASLRSLSTSL